MTDPIGLRRTDMYSYGLTIWQIMCNGEYPWDHLCWDSEYHLAAKKTVGASARAISSSEFESLKSRDDVLLDSAMESLSGRLPSDVNAGKAKAVLKLSLRHDPNLRASSFDEIIRILKDEDRCQSLM